VSRSTAIAPLASKIAREFEADASRLIRIRVMGPQATNIAVKALCVAKTMLSSSGIQNPAQFQAKFIRENELSIVEVLVNLEKGGE